MPRASRTVTIRRPVSVVFAFFTDPGNDTLWRRAVHEIHAVTPLGVGSTVHQLVKGPAGRGVPADFEVTAYDPEQRYEFRVTTGPVRPVGRMRFAEVDGNTTLTFTLEAELAGLQKLLGSRAVQKSMDAELGDLDRARAYLEGANQG